MTQKADPVHPPEGHPPLVYSEDEVVREMTAFYRFLTTLHIPPAALRLAPDNGWKSVTARRFHLAVGRKDPAILSLAQRLPYVSRPSWNEGHEVFHTTVAVDYAKSYLGGLMRLAEAEALGGRKETGEQIMAGGQTLDDLGVNPDRSELVVPEHMLVLASGVSVQNGSFWMLNTRNGTVTIFNGGVRGGKKDGLCSVDPPEHRDDPTTAWRKSETYTLPGFLSLMKRRFRALRYFPMDEYKVYEFTDQEEVTEERRKLVKAFRECGWHEEQQGDDDEGLGDRRVECFRLINPGYEVEEEEEEGEQGEESY